MPLHSARTLTTHASGRSASWLLDTQAGARPDATFLVWEPFDQPARSWTYGRFHDEVARAASALTSRGVGTGDVVLLHLENCPEYLLAWFAVARVGAVAVCTNTRSSLDELTYYVQHSGARHAVTQPSLRAVVEAAIPQARTLVVVSSNAGAAPSQDQRPEAGVRFESLLDQDLRAAPYAGPSSAPASIQYTSGTTGRPKAVVWSHANTYWGAAVNARHEGLTAADRQLSYLPLFHTNAQAYAALATLYAGGALILQPRFSASRFWEVSTRNRATFCSQIYFALKALESQPAPAEHSYRFWATGMSGHPSEQHTGVPTVGWWGMTETISHPVIGDLYLPNRPGSMGRAATEYQIRVVDEDGKPLADPGLGELFVRGVRGVSLFSGYLHDEEATATAFDGDGWFRTGDLVRVDEDGSLFFADRRKDMLKIGAENVAASEIERVIVGVPGVAEVAVVAAPHPMLSEVPVAFVVASDADDPDLDDRVLAACRQRLADFKVPHSIRRIDTLPRGTLEKVAKHQLRELLNRHPPVHTH